MPDAKARTVEFEGVPGSEDDEFHFVTDRKTFERVAGRDPEPDEKVGRDRYKLYPRVWAAAMRSKRKVRVKLTVQPM